MSYLKILSRQSPRETEENCDMIDGTPFGIRAGLLANTPCPKKDFTLFLFIFLEKGTIFIGHPV